MSETLAGTVEHVTFHNAENGFVVFRARVNDRPVTIVGQTPRVVPGERIDAVGVWKLDPDHGEQFHAESLTSRPPLTREGIEKFLGSGLIKGIGPVYAKKIVDVFGDRTLAIIDESPSFLREIKGIGPRRIQEIRESWRQQKTVRELAIFFQAHGMGAARAVRIYKTYGDKALDKVRENPYRLATDVWGIGFATADDLARSMGVPPDSPERARAALRHMLRECTDEGHCAYPEAGLVARSQELTGIGNDILRDALAALVQSEELVRETAASPEPWIYLKRLHHAETAIAAELVELMKEPHPLPAIDVEKCRSAGSSRRWLSPSPTNSREAIRQAVTQKVLVVTGGPGVGKTTLVRGILDVFQAKNLRFELAAPTGRAARRLSESTGQPAQTIQPAARIRRPQDRSGLATSRSTADLLDASTRCRWSTSVLMAALVDAAPRAGCLVLVGDADQLPSVGPGAVLADLIRSERVPVVHLKKIFRQAEASGIVRAAHSVLVGEVPASSTPRIGSAISISSRRRRQPGSANSSSGSSRSGFRSASVSIRSGTCRS